jgi:hypothetical protein
VTFFTSGVHFFFLSHSVLTTCIAYPYAEKLIVLLRDGRKLLGILCSFDQFGMPLLDPLFLTSFRS